MGNPPATKGPAWFQDVSTAFSAWEIPYIYIHGNGESIFIINDGFFHGYVESLGRMIRVDSHILWDAFLRAWNPIIHTFSGKLGMVYY